MESIFLSGLRDQNFRENGSQESNNGTKIGSNGSRIYHVTTLLQNTLITLNAKEYPNGLYDKYHKIYLSGPFHDFLFYVILTISVTCERE